MTDPRTEFIRYLSELERFETERVVTLFDRYHELLAETNEKINLVSRATSVDEFWTRHYLDSITPVRFLDFSGERVLDFGTGGGLPGIPLKILFPDCRMELLDSRRKKCEAVENIVKMLDLKDCHTVISRLEELDLRKWSGRYDSIVCRSVRIEQRFAMALIKLVKPGGRLLFYKAKEVDDLKPFSGIKYYDVSHPELGERRIGVWRKSRHKDALKSAVK